MEKRIQKDSWLRKIWTLAVVGVMAVAGAGSAWGQSYTIQYKNGSRQTNIPERLDTVYIPDGASRELYVPELRNNDGINDTNYQWYVRWYRADANGDPINISGKFVTTNVDYSSFTEEEITLEGGTVDPKNYSAALHTAKEGTSLFWYKPFCVGSSTATGASTILYTRSAGDTEDIVFCDVSMNSDYSPTGSLSDGATLTEPTLSKRYKFVIRPASEIADRIKKANGKGIEHYEISCPADAEGINIQMKTFPSNYCWYNNGNTNDIRSANYFRYTIDTDGDGDVDEGDDLAEDKQVIQIGKILNGKITTRTVVNVYAGGTDTPLLATFTLIPQTNAAFKLEADVKASTDPRRKPDEHPDLYDPIGSADFDMDNAISLSSLSASNNLYDKPMGAELTTYAFFEPNKTIRANQKYSPLQNQYGLYRSANVPNVSEDDGQAGKDYFWFFLYHGHYSPDLYAYDRTYTNTNGQKCGYFFYTDASNEPGRLVKLKLDDVICQYTELTVTAWVNDMTTWEEKKDVGRPLPPNININFIRKTASGEEIVLHRFTSGDALTDYTGKYYVSSEDKTYPANNNVGKWQQLCYTFTISSELQDYDEYYLEVQNNTAHTYGADYAIDDVRVYKSKPRIQVQRYDACDASTLTISSDYETLLRNMGWRENVPVVEQGEELTEDLKKYRFGLEGNNPAQPTTSVADSYVGNAYFSFVEGFDDSFRDPASPNYGKSVTDKTDYNLKENEDPDPIVLPQNTEGNYRWVRVNKSLKVDVPQSRYSFRVIVTTKFPNSSEAYTYPKTRDEALDWEKVYNLRAVNDYNYALQQYIDKKSTYCPDLPDGREPETASTSDLINTKNLTEDGSKTDANNVTNPTNEKEYSDIVEQLYMRLQIPRIRIPWYDEKTGMMYLYALDVNNTDLKYVNEEVGLDENGTVIKASGSYHVVLQGAQAVEGWNPPSAENPNAPSFNLTDKCLLMSPFEVQPAVRITVDTRNNTSGLICLGTERKITAELVGTDGTTLDKGRYGFDWFLGSLEEYNKLNYSGNSVKDAIEEFRKNNGNKESFTDTDVEKWTPGTDELKAIKEGLLELFEDGLLRIDADDFSLLLTEDKSQIVAMPFVNNDVSGDIYCTEITPVNFDLDKNNVPEITPGFGDVSYPTTLTTTPIRLGIRHLHSNTTLKIPLRKDIKLGVATTEGMSNHSLIKNKDNTDVLLYDISAEEMPSVATVNNLKAEDGRQDNYVELTFKNNTNVNYVEGQEYILLIPFSESGDGSSSLGAACDGLAQLHIKIVPEYLTWKGEATELWQSDMKNWTISTSDELYKKVSNTVETPSYSPLYFTKITIPAGKELQLNKPEYDGRVLKSWASEGDDNFRYDMAVNNTGEKEAIKVVPYYINDIEQIYFKPGATLLNQHHLTYDKAWVEFEMTPGDDYWMASPLKEVYAGDMYAPTDGGQQNTEAFTDITYGSGNSRWNPAFYQKAWDNDIKYAASDTDKDGVPDESEIASVKVVPSNWSIEYNDVTVPYTIGKGFYSRVEMTGATDNTVRVRLPKAVNDYKYEYSPTTRALHDVTDKTNQKNLADLDADDGSMTLDLLTKVDNDGNHFLVGNPYMAYLKMDGDNGFLKANEGVIAPKYWTVDGKNGIVVGTPDVKWPTGSELSSGYIAPMQAFFVEKKGDTPTKADEPTDETKMEVTFSADMTVSATKVSSASDTKSFSAVNPVLTLTATSKQGQSRAAVVQKSDASNQYEADKDAVALLDSEIDAPMAYTVAGSYAAAVNAIHDYKNVPLGVYAKDGEEVELSIEGASQLVSPLYLYDAVTRSTTPIDGDSFTLNLTGSSHGRYFLTTDEGIKAAGDIRIYSPADGQLIIASTPSDALKQVQVYDLNGRMVESRQNVGTATCQLYVPGGIYIVRVQSEQGEAQAKLKIK